MPQPAASDLEVVKPLRHRDATHLDDAQLSSRASVLEREVLEKDEDMRDAAQLQVFVPGGMIVEYQHGGLPSTEEVLESQHLPAIAQRIAREQAELGERVEDDAGGLNAFGLLEDRLCEFTELDFGGVIQRVLFRRAILDWG